MKITVDLPESKYPVGTQFVTMHCVSNRSVKNKKFDARINTVVGVLHTIDNTGVLLKSRYLASRPFMGQLLEEEFTDVSVARGVYALQKLTNSAATACVSKR